MTNDVGIVPSMPLRSMAEVFVRRCIEGAGDHVTLGEGEVVAAIDAAYEALPFALRSDQEALVDSLIKSFEAFTKDSTPTVEAPQETGPVEMFADAYEEEHRLWSIRNVNGVSCAIRWRNWGVAGTDDFTVIQQPDNDSVYLLMRRLARRAATRAGFKASPMLTAATLDPNASPTPPTTQDSPLVQA